MHKHFGMHVLSMLVWFLASVGALAWGLKALFDYNLVEKIGSYTSAAVVNPLYYAIGIAGAISLVMFGMACANPDCKC